MKKFFAIIMSLVLALSMMPMIAFAEEGDTPRTFGPDEPVFEDIEGWVIECKDDGANPIYYDNPVFEPEAYEFDIIDAETETLSGQMTPIRPKMNCDIDLSISSNYEGNIYLGAWTVEEQDGESVAVKLGDSIKKGSASISLKNIENNKKIMLVLSLCGDFAEQQIGSYELNLKATATLIGDEPAERCVHVPTLVDKEPASCGYNGYKKHYECQDCWIWLKKNKETGNYTKMSAAEKKAYIIKMPAKKHSFTKKVRNANTRIRKASCTKAAKYYYTCKHCGMIGDKTFTYGKKLGHKYKKNYIIPATTEKNGKIGTICTRCKKVKGKTTTINRIDSMSFVTEPYVVAIDEQPAKYVVKDVKGKTINRKYYKVAPLTFFDEELPKIPMDVDGDGDPESFLVLVAATFSGRYKGSVMGGYVETSHEIDEAWIEEITKYIKDNYADISACVR